VVGDLNHQLPITNHKIRNCDFKENPSRKSRLDCRHSASKRNHKTIAAATDDPEFDSYGEARAVPRHRLLTLRRFSQNYKQLQSKAVEVDEISSVATALPVIQGPLRWVHD